MNLALFAHEADPAALLERAFSRIHAERMIDHPLLNPALQVEALGFRRTELGWVGILVTPWFMNLMLLPAAGRAWRPLPVGQVGSRRRVALPAGDFDLHGGFEDEVGEYHYCSLFSPMAQFADHAQAREVAREIAARLFVVPSEPVDAPPAAAPTVNPSRRRFLGGSRAD